MNTAVVPVSSTVCRQPNVSPTRRSTYAAKPLPLTIDTYVFQGSAWIPLVEPVLLTATPVWTTEIPGDSRNGQVDVDGRFRVQVSKRYGADVVNAKDLIRDGAFEQIANRVVVGCPAQLVFLKRSGLALASSVQPVVGPGGFSTP